MKNNMKNRTTDQARNRESNRMPVAVDFDEDRNELKVFYDAKPVEIYKNNNEGINELIKQLPNNSFVLLDDDVRALRPLRAKLVEHNIPCSGETSKSVLTAIWKITKQAMIYRFKSKS